MNKDDTLEKSTIKKALYISKSFVYNGKGKIVDTEEQKC